MKPTTFKDWLVSKNPLKGRPYAQLFFYIVVTFLALYWQFIFGDKVFAFYDTAIDTYHQYVKVYEFFATAIKNGELTSYTFQYGFGNSIFSMIDWISDPFSMLGVLVGVIFGVKYIGDSMVYILILKHICAGLICLLFLKEFRFSLQSSMIVAYIYAFNGYITTLGEHYFFANRPVYLILLLLILEKVIKGEHKVKYWFGLLYVSLLVAFGGVTCAYEIFLAAGFYTLFRVIYIYGKDIKSIFQRLGICLAFVLGGIITVSALLVPAIDKILGSNRIVHSANFLDYFQLSDSNVVKSSVLRLFSNQLEGTFNDWHGSMGWYTNVFCLFFTVMLVPMVAQFIWITFKDKFSVRKKIFRMVPVAIVAFFIIDQFVPYLFSFFVWHYQSYAYIFLPMYAVLFAEVIDNIKKGSFSRIINWFTVILSSVVILWGGIVSYNDGATTSYMWLMFVIAVLIFGGFTLDILHLSSKNIDVFPNIKVIKKTATITLALLLAFNMFCENYVTTYYGRFAAQRDLTHQPMLTTDIVENVNNKENDNFFRFETKYYEGRMFLYTYSFLFPIRATAYYDSAINNGVPQFYQKMFGASVDVANNYWMANGKVNNTIAEDILGIKYLLLKSDPKRSGWERIEEYPEEGIALYQNQGIDSAGLLFDSYITQAEADNMTFDDRAIGLSTRLVIENPLSNIDDFALKYVENSRFLESDIIGIEDAVIKKNSFVPYAGTITNVDERNNQYNIKSIMNTDASNLSFLLNIGVINNSRKSTQIKFRFNDSSVVKSFVYLDMDNNWKEISKVTPQQADNGFEYTFIIPQTATALALCVNQPCELDVDISTKTVTATYVNEGIQLDNPKRGDTLTGTVTAQKNSLLYLPIPFNKYWNAYIDGEKVEIMKANYAFMAVPITAGEHKVEFIYSNELFNIFLKVSIATFILYNGFFVFCLIFKYRRKNS